MIERTRSLSIALKIHDFVEIVDVAFYVAASDFLFLL